METERRDGFDQFADTCEAVTTIGREAGPEATGLLVALMDANARSLDRTLEMVREGIEMERDRWKARALEAERHLRVIEMRVMGLLREPDPSWDPEDRGM